MAHAQGHSGSAQPFKRRKRVGARECGGKSIYFCIYRKGGDAEGTLANIPSRELREWVKHLRDNKGARLSRTEAVGECNCKALRLAAQEVEKIHRPALTCPACSEFTFIDWYSVPVPSRFTADDQRRFVCRDGLIPMSQIPKFDMGHVQNVAVGSGVTKPRDARKAHPLVKQLDAAHDWPALVASLIGGFDALRALPLAPSDPPDSWMNRSELTMSWRTWFTICERCRSFNRLFYAIMSHHEGASPVPPILAQLFAWIRGWEHKPLSLKELQASALWQEREYWRLLLKDIESGASELPEGISLEQATRLFQEYTKALNQ